MHTLCLFVFASRAPFSTLCLNLYINIPFHHEKKSADFLVWVFLHTAFVFGDAALPAQGMDFGLLALV